MRFLLDQDVYAVTAQFLIHLGHDVVKVAQIGFSQADDEDLLKVAQVDGQGKLSATKGIAAGEMYGIAGE